MFRGRAIEAELRDELESYFEEQVRRHVTSGVDPAAARADVRRRMGSFAAIQEDCRAAWTIRWLDEIRADLTYAIRTYKRMPVLTAAVVGTLALGIGGLIAAFTQFNAVFLRPLPVAAPRELRALAWMAEASGPHRYNPVARFSYPAYQLVRDRVRAFDGVACGSGAFANFGTFGRVEAQVVSGDFFAMLGASALRGRTITMDDERAGTAVAVISDRLWSRAFNRDPAAIGSSVIVNGQPTTIVGVMSPSFFGLNPARAPDAYMSLPMYSTMRFEVVPRRLDDPNDWSACEVVARLRAGATDAQARSETLAVLAAAGVQRPRGAGSALALRVDSAQFGLDDLRAQTEASLPLFLAASATLLIIACVNVAGLLVARIPARGREIGTRLAIGASRGRIVRQLTVEGAVLSLLGAIGGVMVGWAVNRALPGILASIGNAGVDVARAPATIDARVLAVAAAIAFATAMTFGLAPAVGAAKHDFAVLLAGTHASAVKWASRVSAGKWVVAVQAALTVMLLIVAVQLVYAVEELRIDHREHAEDRMLHFAMAPALSGYPGNRTAAFVETVIAELGRAPGVSGVSGIQPMRACPAPRGSPQAVTVAYAITPATVTVRGMQILAGRDFDQHDIAAGRPVAMVSRGFAERFLGGDRAIGESLWPCGTGPARTVVGVVDDRAIFPRNPVLPTVYVPYSQAAGLTTGTTVTFAALAQTTPHDIAGDLRALVSRIGVPVFAIENGVERRERVIARDRTLSHLLTLIGVCALLLAALGTYGVLAYFVRRRTSELGIRMVLGAAPRAVMALVVRQSIPSVATGVLVGVVAARVGRTWLASQLAGVSTWSARAAMTASVVVIGTALAAAAIPAFRAARIDPSRAVRIE